MSTQSHIKSRSEEEVWNAINAFEEILHVIPDDRVALETLYEAYSLLSNQVKAADYLLRLARAVQAEEDREAMQKLLPALRELEGDAEAGALLEDFERQSEEQQAQHEPAEQQAAPPTEKQTPAKAGDITAELAMAWNLLQAGELQEEEYRLVVQDLSESTSRNVTTPVTVLHVLEDRAHPKLRGILSYIAEDTKTPPIGLRHFDLKARLAPALNPEPQLKRGALVFDRLGRDHMVGLLNPYDRDLAKELEESLGSSCHFYLISAADFDYAVQMLRESAQAST